MTNQEPRPIAILFLKFAWVSVGMIIGGVIGVACGFGLSMGLAHFSVWMKPDDPSAGSVAIVAIGLVPGGLIFGAVFGGVLTAMWCTTHQHEPTQT